MKILYAAGEALPFVSTGGLGDVIGSLPPCVKSLLGKKGDVRVVIPLYGPVKEKWGKQLERVYEGSMKLSWRNQYLGIMKTVYRDVTFYFIDNEYYYMRERTYGNFDDGERYAFFSKAVLELMRIENFYPDILHSLTIGRARFRSFTLKENTHILKSTAEYPPFIPYTISNIRAFTALTYSAMYSSLTVGIAVSWNMTGI